MHRKIGKVLSIILSLTMTFSVQQQNWRRRTDMTVTFIRKQQSILQKKIFRNVILRWKRCHWYIMLQPGRYLLQ